MPIETVFGCQPKLLVWDIDGTLLIGRGAGKQAMNESFERCFGIVDAFEEIDLSGAVDSHVFERCFQAHGIHPAKLLLFLDVFYEALEELWYSKASMLPGVKEVLAWSSEQGHVNVIGTGNMKRSAMMKLRKFGLERWFVDGGYADDSTYRPAVIKAAIDRGQQAAGRTFRMEDIWVIGDTPWDIAAGVQNQCRTVGVATGQFSAKQLDDYNPDLLLDTLEQLPGSFSIGRG